MNCCTPYRPPSPLTLLMEEFDGGEDDSQYSKVSSRSNISTTSETPLEESAYGDLREHFELPSANEKEDCQDSSKDADAYLTIETHITAEEASGGLCGFETISKETSLHIRSASKRDEKAVTASELKRNEVPEPGIQEGGEIKDLPLDSDGARMNVDETSIVERTEQDTAGDKQVDKDWQISSSDATQSNLVVVDQSDLEAMDRQEEGGQHHIPQAYTIADDGSSVGEVDAKTLEQVARFLDNWAPPGIFPKSMTPHDNHSSAVADGKTAESTAGLMADPILDTANCDSKRAPSLENAASASFDELYVLRRMYSIDPFQATCVSPSSVDGVKAPNIDDAASTTESHLAIAQTPVSPSKRGVPGKSHLSIAQTPASPSKRGVPPSSPEHTDGVDDRYYYRSDSMTCVLETVVEDEIPESLFKEKGSCIQRAGDLDRKIILDSCDAPVDEMVVSPSALDYAISVEFDVDRDFESGKEIHTTDQTSFPLCFKTSTMAPDPEDDCFFSIETQESEEFSNKDCIEPGRYHFLRDFVFAHSGRKVPPSTIDGVVFVSVVAVVGLAVNHNWDSLERSAKFFSTMTSGWLTVMGLAVNHNWDSLERNAKLFSSMMSGWLVRESEVELCTGCYLYLKEVVSTYIGREGLPSVIDGVVFVFVMAFVGLAVNYGWDSLERNVKVFSAFVTGGGVQESAEVTGGAIRASVEVCTIDDIEPGRYLYLRDFLFTHSGRKVPPSTIDRAVFVFVMACVGLAVRQWWDSSLERDVMGLSALVLSALMTGGLV